MRVGIIGGGAAGMAAAAFCAADSVTLLEKNENTYASERWRLIRNAGNHLEQPSGNAAPDGDRLRDHDGAGHRAVD